MPEREFRVGSLLISAGVLLSVALLAGRIAGFGRELILASTLGVSQEADLAVLLLTLPDLLVNLLLSGGLSVALIPVLRSAPPSQATLLFLQASLAVGLGFGLLAVAIALTPDWWLAALAPGTRFSASVASIDKVYLIALAVPLTALSGVSTAYLNSRDRFFAAGCGTLVFNLCVIAGLLVAQRLGAPIDWLCWSILAGAGVRWLSQLIALPRSTWRLQASGWLLDRVVFQAFGAAFLASSLMLLVPVIVRAMASLLGEGTIASFNYATKLIELPIGILITTLATVAFPRLSEMYASDRSAEASQLLVASLQRAAVLSMAVVLTGLWFADSLVSLLFLRGRIDAGAVRQITLLTQVALLGVPLVGISSLAGAALNAQRRTGAVLRATLACLVALPLLAAPGLWLHSSPWLMAAVVAYQGLLAMALMRSAKMRWIGALGWVNRRMLGCFSCAVGLAAVFYALDGLIGSHDARWRSALAVAMFLSTALAGVRVLSRSSLTKGPAAE